MRSQEPVTRPPWPPAPSNKPGCTPALCSLPGLLEPESIGDLAGSERIEGTLLVLAKSCIPTGRSSHLIEQPATLFHAGLIRSRRQAEDIHAERRRAGILCDQQGVVSRAEEAGVLAR